MKQILRTYICPFLLKYEGFSTATWWFYISRNDGKNSHCEGFSVPEIYAKIIPKHWFFHQRCNSIKRKYFIYIYVIYQNKRSTFHRNNHGGCWSCWYKFLYSWVQTLCVVYINCTLTSGQKLFCVNIRIVYQMWNHE